MLPLIGIMGGYLFDFFRNRREINRAATANKVRLLSDPTANNKPHEMAALSGSDSFLKKLSFCILMAPFVMCGFAPHLVANYFNNLSVIPEYYKEMAALMVAAIWGWAPFKNNLLQIVDAFKGRK